MLVSRLALLTDTSNLELFVFEALPEQQQIAQGDVPKTPALHCESSGE